MAELKTRKTGARVSTFLDAIPNAQRRADCRTIAKLMSKATGAPPKMWGPSIVGFGDRTYTSARGREVAWFEAGFSPRAQNLTVYLMGGAKRDPALLKRLGPHSTGASCLYIKRLADVNLAVLEELIDGSLRVTRESTTSETTRSARPRKA